MPRKKLLLKALPKALRGLAEGKSKEQSRYSRLILLLADDGKNDQIVKAASDVHLLESLYREYGL